MKITPGGVSGVILVQARDCSERIMKQWRNIGWGLVKYLSCEHACTHVVKVTRTIELEEQEVSYLASRQIRHLPLTLNLLNLFPQTEIPEFLSDEECEHIISLAKESGLAMSIAGFDPAVYEGDLDADMKEAGK